MKKHIEDVEYILTRLEEVNLTLSLEKSNFGVEEIIVVGHLYGSYGRKLNPEKIDAISSTKACKNTTEVRRFWKLVDFIIFGYLILGILQNLYTGY